MSQRYSGGVISATPVEPSGNFETDVASGVWTLQEALKYTKAGNWPTAGNTATIGLFMGGYNATASSFSAAVDKIVIETTGDATDFGDLSGNRYLLAGVGSSTRAVFGNHYLRSSGSTSNIIEYFTFSAKGKSTARHFNRRNKGKGQ